MFYWLHLFISVACLTTSFHTSNAFIIDACRSVKCENKDEIPCLEIFPESQVVASYECRCAKECKTIKYIRGPVVRTMPPSYFNNLNNIQNVSQSDPIPIAKQGGSACYQGACMNGGTCYSNVSPTTPSGPICACQPQFTGSRCEQYNPTSSPDNWNNLCRVYNDRNMNICQNGGQCVFITDGKVACVCPSNFVGQYCELPLYIQCQAPAHAQCHRDYGTCQHDGSCLCRPGYCGPKCDAPINIPTQPYQPPTLPPTIQPGNCQNFCQNGGSCTPTSTYPYISCFCKPQYTGTNCQTITPTAPSITTTTTSVPRCNFTIGLRNEGAYTSRFKVEYYIDGIRQPLITSDSLPFINTKTQVVLPYYAKDVKVTLEKLGLTYTRFAQDVLPSSVIATSCTKCYKTWGTVLGPSWDYITC